MCIKIFKNKGGKPIIIVFGPRGIQEAERLIIFQGFGEIQEGIWVIL
jgi:hypothetical protein